MGRGGMIESGEKNALKGWTTYEDALDCVLILDFDQSRVPVDRREFHVQLLEGV